ncbi:MAG: AarF/ABC1/UbiB kinase family protein, partial [Planctomycetes bacterium]|nr:AarF/ABC1/UbiB kinase family protein [Planctomycetota bacterium]
EAAPWPRIEAALVTSLGRPVAEVFTWVDPEPLAAASVGQVHRAKLKTPQGVVDVAVKVQRPGIASKIERDVELLYWLARLIERSMPEAAHYAPVKVVGEFDRALSAELDFRTEAENAKRFAAHFEHEPRVPQLRHDAEHPPVCVGVADQPFARQRVAVEQSGADRAHRVVDDVEHRSARDRTAARIEHLQLSHHRRRQVERRLGELGGQALLGDDAAGRIYRVGDQVARQRRHHPVFAEVEAHRVGAGRSDLQPQGTARIPCGQARAAQVSRTDRAAAAQLRTPPGGDVFENGADQRGAVVATVHGPGRIHLLWQQLGDEVAARVADGAHDVDIGAACGPVGRVREGHLGAGERLTGRAQDNPDQRAPCLRRRRSEDQREHRQPPRRTRSMHGGPLQGIAGEPARSPPPTVTNWPRPRAGRLRGRPAHGP